MINVASYFTKKSALTLFVCMSVLTVFFCCNEVNAATKMVPITASDYNGLYKTGYNGGKMGGGQADPHWAMTEVYNVAGLPINHNGNIDSYHVWYGDGNSATTVVEKGDAGYGYVPGSLNVGVGYHDIANGNADANWVWRLTDPSSRWISINEKAQHKYDSSHMDPSIIKGSDGLWTTTQDSANVYVFKTKFNITNNKVNLSSLKFSMSIDADNWIKVYANGVELKSNSSTTGNAITKLGWVSPDFLDDMTANYLWSGDSGQFKYGENKIEVHVLSTATNIGFIANQIELTGEKEETIPDPSTACRPQTVVIQPRQYSAKSPASYQTGNLHSYNGHVIPVDLYISSGGVETKIGAYSNIKTTTTADITKYITTGKVYSVYVKEVEQYIVGYDDHQVDDKTKPIYGTKEVCTGTGKKRKCSWVTDTSKIIGYHQKYGYSTDRWSTKDYAFATTPATVGPCYDYQLSYSSTAIDHSSAVEPGTPVNFSLTIGNSSFTSGKGMTAKVLNGSDFIYKKYGWLNSTSKSTDVYIVKIRDKDGSGWNNIDNIAKNKSVQADNNSAPCSYFGGYSTTCNIVAQTKDTIQSGSSVSKNFSFIIPDEPVGTKYCFASSLFSSTSEPNNNSSSTSGGEYHHSIFTRSTNCFVIVKKPKTQILGGDLIVGRKMSVADTSTVTGNISTSTSIKIVSAPSTATFGSWVEYGVFAPGTISGLASGSAFSSAGGLVSSNGSSISKCKYNTLTFANTPQGSKVCSTGVSLGNYKNSRLIPNVAASFQNVDAGINTTPAIGNNLSLTGYNGQYRYDGNSLTIQASTIRKNNWVVINAPNARVTINGDINYENVSFGSVSEIPQLVIIARDIDIVDEALGMGARVSNVDAWLVASGTINTCSSVTSTALSSKLCTDKLTVNGPVMAKTLRLRRTAGSGVATQSGDPAEVFNLRADAYLWAMGRAKSTKNIKTTYVTELPPRV